MIAECPKDVAVEDQMAAASYLAAMAATMATMARVHGFDTLGYLFEMARLEAENAGRLLPGA
jgi:alcohol dehydrogenase class IV